MATIVGIAGSLRSGSFNAALLRAAGEDCTIDIASLWRIPLYNGDIETSEDIPSKYLRG